MVPIKNDISIYYNIVGNLKGGWDEGAVTWSWWLKNRQACYYSLIPMFINMLIIQAGYLYEFPNCLSKGGGNSQYILRENIEAHKKELLKR